MRLSSQRRPRSGFTMVELMVVIVILAFLAALLLAALNKVMVFMDDVRAVAEVGHFAQGLESFKNTFGRYPPSAIVLREAADAYSTAPDYASLNYLTAIFPGFDESVAHDWNQDGDTNDTLNLQGDACLVYFLLGPPVGADRIPNGFTTSKSNPVAFAVGANQRLGPFFDANMARLAPNYDAASGLYRGYNDPWGTRYAYFLALDTDVNNYRGYLSYYQQPCDCAGLCGATFMPYFQSPSSPILPTMATPVPNAINFHRGDKFQIISAGRDQRFGPGGHYNQADPQASTWNGVNAQNTISPDQGRPGSPTLPDRQQDDYDNITNFTEGKMVQ